MTHTGKNKEKTLREILSQECKKSLEVLKSAETREDFNNYLIYSGLNQIEYNVMRITSYANEVNLIEFAMLIKSMYEEKHTNMRIRSYIKNIYTKADEYVQYPDIFKLKRLKKEFEYLEEAIEKLNYPNNIDTNFIYKNYYYDQLVDLYNFFIEE